MTRSKAPGKMYDIGRGPAFASSALPGPEGAGWPEYGARLRTADGGILIDMLCALGALSLGYRCVWSMSRDVNWNATLPSLPSELEGAAAERVLTDISPWASSVKFLKTGSEATHAAYVIAKAATGRRHVMTGDWAYHGWHEWCWYDGVSRVSQSGTGHRYAHNQDMNDAVRQAGLLPSSIAAVFVEPHRWEALDRSWMRHVWEWCKANGALLVFDEMIYGGRMSVGGVSELFGIVPDLACYGKAFGNGVPVAFVVGNDAMRDWGSRISGTYNGDVLALCAFLNVTDVYRTEPVIATMWARGHELRTALQEVVARAPVECSIVGTVVHQKLVFHGPDGAARGRAFSGAMVERGVLWHPDVVNLCYGHTAEDIAAVGAAAHDSMRAAFR